MSKQLPNGATIIERTAHHVLARTASNDYATWTIDADGNTYHGHYFQSTTDASLAAARADLVARAGYKPQNKLLSIDSNAKTVKGQKYGFMTAILYLAPHAIAGPNVCANSEIAGCQSACLYSAGRGAMSSVQNARINKTKYFHADRAAFMVQLHKEIAAFVRKAKRKGLTPLVRLNGTSDIRWEREALTVNGAQFDNLMSAYPTVQFYDYTKLANRRNVPANYDLTFSYSGRVAYQSQVQKAIENGMRIAVVFAKREEIPQTFLGLSVVDGDDSDIRHIDPVGAVVALYAKGAAKKDKSGFVVHGALGTAPRMINQIPVNVIGA